MNPLRLLPGHGYGASLVSYVCSNLVDKEAFAFSSPLFGFYITGLCYHWQFSFSHHFEKSHTKSVMQNN